MSFGATITSGDNNTALPDELSQWLVEARVEQELSKATKFAIRFEDDICQGGWAVANASEIDLNTMISVLAPSGNKLACLVRGRITKVKSAAQIGGTGSWVEIHGEDRRVEMDRITVQANWQGAGKGIVESVLGGYQLTPDVDDLEQSYDEEEQLNQRGTDLAFVNKIASENGLEFWVTYEVGDLSPLSQGIPISEKASVKRSPPEAGAFNLGALPLLPDDPPPVFRVNVQGDLCPNVNTFNAEIDTERPNQGTGSTVDVAGVETESAQTDAVPAPVGEGTKVADVDGVVRTISTAAPGDAAEQRRRQEAALRDAAWFIEGTASVSAHQLGAVLNPHEIIEVTGSDYKLNIPYQVKSVIHVINASDHMMDVKMRSNILGTKP